MRAIGITDERTSCDCCGKADLKCTVAMETDSGDIVYYGRVCASRNSGKSTAQINKEVKTETARIKNAAITEYHRSIEYLADEAKMSQGSRLGLRPVEFIEFHRAEMNAATAKRKEIAARFGLDVWAVV